MPQISVTQGIALAVLCRLAAFLTDSCGYTTPFALGALLAVCTQFLFVILLRRIRPPHFLRTVSSAAAAVWAGALCLRLHRLLCVLHAPVPLITLGLLLATVCLMLRHPFAAAARTAAVFLMLSAIALLLLPVSAIGTAEPVYLHMKGSLTGGFLCTWAISGDLFLLLPILRHAEKRDANRILTGWAVGCGLVIPAVILLGTMQNGRLLGFGGAPFFMLLARTPLSDALRTDGFWLLLAVSLTALSAAALLRNAMTEMRDTK